MAQSILPFQANNSSASGVKASTTVTFNALPRIMLKPAADVAANKIKPIPAWIKPP